MDAFDELAKWYETQCNGSWEHQFGITIESMDNPGWWVKINLEGTQLKSKKFVTVMTGVDKDRHPRASSWINCWVEDGKFNGAGDPKRLKEIIRIFLGWANGQVS